MSSSSTLGRHRAVPARSNPMTAISKAVSSNAGSVGRQAAVIAAASGLVLSVGVPAQAASIDRDANAVTAVTALQSGTANVVVPADIEVSFDRASVTSAAAPAAEISVQSTVTEEVAPAPAPAPAPAETPAASEAAPAPAVEAEVTAEAETKPEAAAEVSASGFGAALVGSAYSQIGIAQDCTAMVEKALRSIGKSVGDIGPSGFFAYGSVVGSPAAGDLVVSGGHVGIYVGNGQVISGGYNGLNTVLHPLSALSGYSFVRVN